MIPRRFTVLALLLGSLLGCAANGGDLCPASIDASQCRNHDASADAAQEAAPSPTQLLSIELAPRDPALVWIDGSHPTVDFTVIGHQRDGRTRPVTAVR
ncbi:MAG: hypothetical protein WCJ30_24370, partial [Deltaproteobacteria bacterium]